MEKNMGLNYVSLQKAITALEKGNGLFSMKQEI